MDEKIKYYYRRDFLQMIQRMLMVLFAALLIFPVTYAEASSFSDVSLYEKEIQFLVDEKVLTGYEDGSFKPKNNLNRLNGVQVLLRAKGITNFDAPNPGFTDMTPTTHGYAEVAKAVELGMISGKTNADGSRYFDPTAPLTRGQMAKIIVEAMDYPVDTSYTFRDVPASNGFAKYISTLAAAGVTEGYEDNTFRPNLAISRQHFALFVARMLNDVFKPEPRPTSFKFNPSMDYVRVINRDGYSYTDRLRYVGPYHGTAGSDTPVVWDQWVSISPHDQYDFVVLEDKNRLLTGYPGSEFDIDLEYPIYQGKTFYSAWGDRYDIAHVGLTLTTEAGTFNQVIAVKDEDGYIVYYAPNIGAIKTVLNGKTTMELMKLEPR